MKFLSVFAMATFCATATLAADVKPAPSGTYVSDPAHSSVTWKISHLGLSNYTARFTKMSAELVWDAENPASSKVTAVIDPLSVRTDFLGRRKRISTRRSELARIFSRPRKSVSSRHPSPSRKATRAR
ncbi:YceI family protein [Aliirhizobium terrae]|uniref:YceI family protein n=1 Tax=Terrirhizobium terrae TaxID=2926709 RepID=UPI0025778C86|nr:YceI family protein [Rhizobium sp. CC-CFT758]WJH40677.1 YceI family protein [Rhizobium sp. CC-CFT758]